MLMKRNNYFLVSILIFYIIAIVYFSSMPVNAATWTYIGDCTSYSGDGTSELTFNCVNASVKVKACSSNVIKVWCEPSKTFARDYPSFAITNEDISPYNLTVTDNGTYYSFSTSEVKVQINKSPFRIRYYDINNNLLCKNEDSKGMGWSSDKEVAVWNVISSNEYFWGLGEKKESFNKLGKIIYQWCVDVLGSSSDTIAPPEGQGRWYGADPHFLSSKGYSIYFDNTSRTCFDMGATINGVYSFGSYNPAPGGELLYYFVYGPTPKKMVKTFTDMSGKSFFAPEWALGNMQSHWGYTQSDIQNVAATYRNKNLPCDVLMSDIEWYGQYCTPTYWNSTNYPNPSGMIADLDSKGFKYGVIDDPNINTSSGNYSVGNSNGYFIKNNNNVTSTIDWPWGGNSGVIDFFNPSARSWWENLHNHLINEGIDMLWCDMNEPARYNLDWTFNNEFGGAKGNIFEMHNAFSIMHNKSIFDWMKSYSGKRPFVMTRSFFTGSQRYASPWTGDTAGDYASMADQIRYLTGLSFSGFNYAGFDVGGFTGCGDNEFKRWIEFATFIPVERFHYANWVAAQEPWTKGAADVARKYLTLRYRLIPYTYSCMADAIVGTGLDTSLGSGATGIPALRPMVMEFPYDTNTYSMDTQFMSGPNILVAPVTADATTKSVYLPQSAWYDYNDGKTVYSGNQTITYNAPLEKLPVFVKEGSIIPMMPEMQFVGQRTLDNLTLDIFPQTGNGTNSFTLYEDDGVSNGYENGAYCTTKYDCTVLISGSSIKNTLKVNARQQGAIGYNPSSRSYIIQFHKSNLTGLTIKKDGTSMTSYSSITGFDGVSSGWYLDPLTDICYVKVPDSGSAFTIELNGNRSYFEAENATLSGGAAVNTNHIGYSGSGFADKFETVGAKALFNINVPSAGTYTVNIKYANSTGRTDTASLYINGIDVAQISMSNLDNWDTWGTVNQGITLNAGANTIAIQYDSSDNGRFNLDYIQVRNNSSPTGLYRIKNRYTNKYMHVQNLNGKVELGPLNVGWWSMEWIIEDTSDGYKRIKNRWSGDYLNNEDATGVLKYSPLNISWHSMQWSLDNADPGYVRFKSRWDEHADYMHNENNLGYIETGFSPVNWWSAMWVIEPVN